MTQWSDPSQYTPHVGEPPSLNAAKSLGFESFAFFDHLFGAWTDLSPTISSGATLGNGTLTSRQFITQGRGAIQGRFELGSTSAISGRVVINHGGEVETTNIELSTGFPLLCMFYDLSADRFYPAIGRLSTSTLTIQARNATPSASVPFTWATGDAIIWSGSTRDQPKVTL